MKGNSPFLKMKNIPSQKYKKRAKKRRMFKVHPND
jgi:hypothetical protein